jgi:hypothetical protein
MKMALKCAKPLPDDAQFTVQLSDSLIGRQKTESNLSPQAQTCLSVGVTLLGTQIGLLFAKSSKPPTALNFTIADVPREDGSRGQLVFHFKR